MSFVFLGGARRLKLSPCNTCSCSIHQTMKVHEAESALRLIRLGLA